MPDPAWPLGLNIVVFVLAAGAIGVAGTMLAGLADRLADRTGLGEAITGTLFLGLTTALPGIAASVTAALDGYPAMAISNAMGGIAVQTAFLAVADIFYSKINLEHAAASATNMMQTAVLILLISLVLLGLAGPSATVAHVHPVTLILLLAAGFGFWLSYRTGARPMWQPRMTAETVTDIPEPAAQRESLPRLLAGLLLTVAVVLGAGVAVAHSAGGISDQTGLSQSLMGGLFLAVATSLPELVTTVAAVRRGALTLAVSDIVGGNFFDVLFVCFADFAYLGGSLYHAADVGRREIFLTGLTVLMNITLLMGLIYRQKRGPGNIGFESGLMLAMYVGGFVILWLFL